MTEIGPGGRLPSLIKKLQEIDQQYPNLPVFIEDSEVSAGQPAVVIDTVNVYEYQGPALIFTQYTGGRKGLW